MSEKAMVDATSTAETSPRYQLEMATATESAEAASEVAQKLKSHRGWTRTGVNFLLDATLLITFVAMLGAAAVVRFCFPPASTAAGWKLWEWSLDQWNDFQFAALALFTLAILLHVMLHWSWVCGVVSNKLSKRRGHSVRIDESSKTLWGVGLLILIVNLLGLLLALATLMIQRPPA